MIYCIDWENFSTIFPFVFFFLLCALAEIMKFILSGKQIFSFLRKMKVSEQFSGMRELRNDFGRKAVGRESQLSTFFEMLTVSINSCPFHDFWGVEKVCYREWNIQPEKILWKVKNLNYWESICIQKNRDKPLMNADL